MLLCSCGAVVGGCQGISMCLILLPVIVRVLLCSLKKIITVV